MEISKREAAKIIGVSRQAIIGLMRRGTIAAPLTRAKAVRYKAVHEAIVSARNEARKVRAAKQAAMAKEGTY